MGDPVAELRSAVEAAASTLRDGAEAGGSAPTLERPAEARVRRLLDQRRDAARAGARRAAAGYGGEARGASSAGSLEGSLEQVEVAGPGFLNLFLADAWYRRAAARAGRAGRAAGRPAGADEVTERINVEFVSANPTGPADRGRRAARRLGDSIARVLEFAGHPVVREYYVNDRGGQIDLLRRLDRGADEGRAGAGGRLRGRLRRRLGRAPRAGGHRPRRPRRARAPRRGADGRADRGDPAAATASSSTPGPPSAPCTTPAPSSGRWPSLREAGHVYESEGATWLRTTDFGDDKDRVLIRSDGDPTYFLSDIAYHRDKLERGADRLINVLGADHHGYVERLRAALAALGYDPDALEMRDHAARPRGRGRRARPDVEAAAASSSPSTS